MWGDGSLQGGGITGGLQEELSIHVHVNLGSAVDTGWWVLRSRLCTLLERGLVCLPELAPRYLPGPVGGETSSRSCPRC